MRLNVLHETIYRYDPPKRGVIQSHRLWPASFEGQTVIDWDVRIEGAERGAGFRDGAGDWIETVTLSGEVSEMTVSVEGTVETTDQTGFLRGHRERVRPEVYLRDTAFTGADDAIRELAAKAVEGVENPLDQGHALMNTVRDAIVYEPGRTDPATTAADALETGAGVCQDHAHVLIAAAVSLGIPGRYATGYLHAVGDIAEASHAWAELNIEGLGWIGFDASNGVCPDEHYVRLGSGFDALDAAPIRGVAVGEGRETLDIDVKVVEQAQ